MSLLIFPECIAWVCAFVLFRLNYESNWDMNMMKKGFITDISRLTKEGTLDNKDR